MRKLTNQFILGALFLIGTIAQYIIGKILDQMNITFPILSVNISDIILYIGLLVGIPLIIWGIWISKQNENPIKMSKGIKFYNSRNDLPHLKDFLLLAKENIYILGASLETIAQEPSIITTAIDRGVHVTFLILNSESAFLTEFDGDILCGTKGAINASLERLCEIKNKLSLDNQSKCEIKVYDYPLFNSMIALDPNEEYGDILIESHLYKLDTKLRPSIRISRKKHESLFLKYWNHYNYIITEHAKVHECPNRND